MKKLAAFWIREGKNKETGEPMKYFSGVLEDMRGDIPVVVFKNTKKEKENHPDYIMYLSEPQVKREEGEVAKEEEPDIL